MMLHRNHLVLFLIQYQQLSHLLFSCAARRHHDSGGNHQCEGGGDHQGGPRLPQLQEVAHQHVGSGEGERRHQWALFRRHALPQVD